MSFDYKVFRKNYTSKYKGRLSEGEVDMLLTFDSGMMKDKFPRKRIIINRIRFKGLKSVAGEKSIIDFDRAFGAGLWMILADNLKGKSTLFKVIKFGLTGESGELGHEMKAWLHHIYIEFRINDTSYTSYINLEGTRLNATLYTLPIVDIIDKEIDNSSIILMADNAGVFQSKMEDFFFKELEFYHLSWTQKASQKDRIALNESKATWNTYFESIYLTSRSFDKLGFGNQEGLIFQMLLGLSFTYPINRLKVASEKLLFDIAKLRDQDQAESKRKAVELKGLEKELEKVEKELGGLNTLEQNEDDVSELFEVRMNLSALMETNLSNQYEMESDIFSNRVDIENIRKANIDLASKGKNYNLLITKATRTKISLEEHINFGIFFSNLEIKICPHCNSPVSVAKKEMELSTKECQLCSHQIDDAPAVDKNHFQAKIDSLDAEIKGYTHQRDLLRAEYSRNQAQSAIKRQEYQSKELQVKDIKAANRTTIQKLRDIDHRISKAKKKGEAATRILELERKKAVLKYRVEEAKGNAGNTVLGEIAKEQIKVELLNEALAELKRLRESQNESILNAFKELLLDELKDLGIANVSEIHLSDAFKINYKINDTWVGFDDISEGEQLRVKLAFYLSIIQLDSRFEAGKHPRILIIDSPSKEEGDRNFHNGLKKVLANVSEKYADDVQIIIGTASRELQDAVPKENAYVYAENEYLF